MGGNVCPILLGLAWLGRGWTDVRLAQRGITPSQNAHGVWLFEGFEGLFYLMLLFSAFPRPPGSGFVGASRDEIDAAAAAAVSERMNP